MKKKNQSPPKDVVASEADAKVLFDIINNSKADPDKYLPILDEKIAANPDHILMRWLRADIKSENPETIEEAIEEWTVLMELAPNDYKYPLNRAICYETQNYYESAFQDIEHAHKLKGDSALLSDLIRLATKTYRVNYALNLYHQDKILCSQQAPDELFELAKMLEERDSLTEALDILELIEHSDGSFEYFDARDMVDGIKERIHRRELDKYRNVPFEDPKELERHFKKIADISRLSQRHPRTELSSIAKIIYFKRILDVTSELGENSPFESINFPYQLNWHTKYSGRRPHPKINYSGLSFGGVSVGSEELLIAIVYEVTEYSYEEVTDILDRLKYSFKLSNISVPVFGEAFSLFIHNWINSSSQRIGIYSTSQELGQLIGKVLKINDQESIYDPAAGTASLLLNSTDRSLDTAYYPRIVGGNEPNEEQYLLAQMNLILNGYDTEKLTQFSPFQKVGGESDKYDVAICLPVFGKKVHRMAEDFPNYLGFPTSDREFAYLEVMLAKLKSEGRFAIVLPTGALFSGGKIQAFRKELLKRDYVDLVLGLPEDIHHFTRVKTAIIFGRKREVPRSETDLRISLGELQSVDHIDELEILGPNDISGFPNGGPTKTTPEGIANYNYNLDPTRWNNEAVLDATISIESSDIARRLSSEIINTSQGGIGYKGSDTQTDGAYPLVRITELANDPLNNTLIVKSNTFVISDKERTIKRGIAAPKEKHIINRDCLLIATKGNLLKPTIFKYSGSPIVIANGVFALFVNEDLLSLEYLANEFASGFVEEQVKLLRTGAFIPYLRQSDILKILVEVPTLEEQSASVRRFKDFYLKKKLGSDDVSKQLLDKKSQDFSKTLELMQHQLKEHIASIRSNSLRLRGFLQQKHPNLLSECTLLNKTSSDVDISTFTLDNLISKLERAASNMTEELEIINQRKLLENYEPDLSLIPIYDFLREVKSAHETERVQIHINRNKQHIAADAKMLRSMFNMIVDNACRHGLKAHRILNIWFETNPNIIHDGEKYFQVVCRNDGNPLPPGFTREIFESYRGSLGDHANKGVGGNHITFILKKHKGLMRQFKNLASGEVEMEILLPTLEV